jgi:hypothetical protein
MPMRAFLLLLLLLSLLALLFARGWRPPDRFNPWAALDLRAAPDVWVRYKLARLADDPAQCRAALTRAGADFSVLPDRQDSRACGWTDAVRLRGTGVARLQRPAIVSCPLAASLVLFDGQVLQPAARRQWGQPVRQIEHFGSYACRNLYHRSQAPRSTHASAAAIDLSGFRLADGRRIQIASDWPRADRAAVFLHDVHTEGCAVTGMLLGPDYNLAHRDHFHLQQRGWGYCR